MTAELTKTKLAISQVKGSEPTVNAPTQRVLWIRVGALGDLLIATAALRQAMDRFAKCDFYVLGDRLWVEILEPTQWPQLKGVYTWPGAEERAQSKIRAKSELPVSFPKLRDKKTVDLYVPAANESEYWQTRNSTSHAQPGEPLDMQFYKQFDVVINHRIESYRYAWGPWLARTPLRIGSCPWPMKWLYTHWSPWLGKDPLIHERDWHLFVANAPKTRLFPLGFTSKNRKQLEILSASSAWKGRGLPRLKSFNEKNMKRLTDRPNKSYWLINPTASRPEKAWPAEKFAKLTDLLKEALQKQASPSSPPKKIFVIGSPKETAWLNAVACGRHDILQPESLRDLIDIVGGAAQLVTNTSSMQFIAATTETPVLTLMGQAPREVWGPIGEKDQVVRGTVPKNFKGGLFERDFAAYDSISVSEVIESLAPKLRPI